MVINLEMLKRTLQESTSTGRELRGRQERYAEVLTDEIAKLNRILGSLLDLTSPHVERKHDIDLRGLGQGLQTLIASQAQKQGILLDFQVPSASVSVHGYEIQLRQAILNVIVNAFDAMSKEGVLEVRITMDEQQGLADLTICDTGPGIPSSIADHIFDIALHNEDHWYGHRSIRRSRRVGKARRKHSARIRAWYRTLFSLATSIDQPVRCQAGQCMHRLKVNTFAAFGNKK